MEAFWALLQNTQYLKLVVAFGVAIGNLNTTTALLAQLPTNLTAGEVGVVGFSIILCGFAGAILTGALLSRTRAYETILKVTYAFAVLFYLCLMLCCYDDNFSLIAFMGKFRGLWRFRGLFLFTGILVVSYFM